MIALSQQLKESDADITYCFLSFWIIPIQDPYLYAHVRCFSQLLTFLLELLHLQLSGLSLTAGDQLAGLQPGSHLPLGSLRMRYMDRDLA